MAAENKHRMATAAAHNVGGCAQSVGARAARRPHIWHSSTRHVTSSLVIQRVQCFACNLQLVKLTGCLVCHITSFSKLSLSLPYALNTILTSGVSSHRIFSLIIRMVWNGKDGLDVVRRLEPFAF